MLSFFFVLEILTMLYAFFFGELYSSLSGNELI